MDAWCCETSSAGADDEAVWFWRLDAGVKFARSRERRGQDSPIPEKSTGISVNTIARGMSVGGFNRSSQHPGQFSLPKRATRQGLRLGFSNRASFSVWH
jgi:hypothetical protein